ncbi:MAG: hypothetical protein IJ153_01295 [Clostridia bacterium]|nr:hypothetical protein [Clostridia bacterium]
MQKTMDWRRFAWRMGILAVLFLILYLVFSSRLEERQQQENALRLSLTRLEEENKAMDAELKLVDTEDYIVTSAMTNYAFMNKNDLRFQFTNPDALYAYTESELKILMDEMAD